MTNSRWAEVVCLVALVSTVWFAFQEKSPVATLGFGTSIGVGLLSVVALSVARDRKR
jgi:hypothetical protein